MQYGYKVMVMVGDGATDLEARQNGGADIFIGSAHNLLASAKSFCVLGSPLTLMAQHRYGGTVVRPSIAAQADWYVNSMQPLIEALG